jgi:hypothetical protein
VASRSRSATRRSLGRNAASIAGRNFAEASGRAGLRSIPAPRVEVSKECARWVAEAKKQETRDRRAAKAIEMLLEGKRR